MYTIPGYTSHMVNFLETSHGFVVDSRAFTVGGPGRVSPMLKVECRKQMQVWIRMLGEVLASEFPGWDILSAFSVFELKPAASRRQDDEDVILERDSFLASSAQRLAQVFNFNLEGFIAELEDHRPVAQHLLVSQQMANFEAWAAALRRTQKRKCVRDQHPCDNLLCALAKYGAFQGASTAGVEQLFSQVSKQTSPARKHMGPQLLLAEVKIFADYTRAESGYLVEVAQIAWTLLGNGKPRNCSQTERLDAGIKRKPAEDTSSVA